MQYADGVTAEMLKAEEAKPPSLLMCIFIEYEKAKRFLKRGRPESLSNITQKGDFGDCDNWRGVTLLPITRKVFSKTIYTRLTEALDEYVR